MEPDTVVRYGREGGEPLRSLSGLLGEEFVVKQNSVTVGAGVSEEEEEEVEEVEDEVEEEEEEEEE